MKRIFPWLLVLPLFVVACMEETPVKEVRTCSKVVKVELITRSYYFSLDGVKYVHVKLTTANGRHFYKESWEYKKREDGSFLKTATKMEMGKEYCWTEYESVR